MEHHARPQVAAGKQRFLSSGIPDCVGSHGPDKDAAKRLEKCVLLIIVLVIPSVASVARAYADWPTPLISVRCLSSMHLLTLNVIFEWNLCTHGQNCKAPEDRGSYPDEYFLKRFKKAPGLCQVNGVDSVTTSPHAYGINNRSDETEKLLGFGGPVASEPKMQFDRAKRLIRLTGDVMPLRPSLKRDLAVRTFP